MNGDSGQSRRGGLEEVQRADGVRVEIVEGDVSGAIVRGLRGGVDDHAHAPAPRRGGGRGAGPPGRAGRPGGAEGRPGPGCDAGPGPAPLRPGADLRAGGPPPGPGHRAG